MVYFGIKYQPTNYNTMAKHLDGFVKITKNGNFYLSGGTVEAMDLKEGDGVMIYLCKRKGCVFLLKESEESFIIRRYQTFLTFKDIDGAILVRLFFGVTGDEDLRLSAINEDGKIRLVKKID